MITWGDYLGKTHYRWPRAGVIGCGRIARARGRAYVAVENNSLVAGADPDASQRSASEGPRTHTRRYVCCVGKQLLMVQDTHIGDTGVRAR